MTSSPPALPSIPTVEVAGIPICDVTFDETVEFILAWAAERSGGYVCTPNVDHVVRAQRDPAFRKAILAARIRVPDGMWIIRAARLAGLSFRETVTGRLLVPAIADRSRTAGLGIALFGSAPGVAEAAASALSERYPGVAIVSAISPPMGLVIGSAIDAEAVETLKSANPSVIFVGLGAPKQERWMERHADDFPGVVMVGIGQALDVLAGRVREAPPWATRLGFEWVFRLVQEPRRLARRYLVDDPWIFGWALSQRLGRRPRP
jgi:N-acetylglucosaminyldiphosphoundecaprenol N-acetyl-beta-D-mannosaminyltransferase